MFCNEYDDLLWKYCDYDFETDSLYFKDADSCLEYQLAVAELNAEIASYFDELNDTLGIRNDDYEMESEFDDVMEKFFNDSMAYLEIQDRYKYSDEWLNKKIL